MIAMAIKIRIVLSIFDRLISLSIENKLMAEILEFG